MSNNPAILNAIDDAQAAAALQALYWRAGGRHAATPKAMLRRIADDASNLLRVAAFPPAFESTALAVLQRHGAAMDAELRIDLLALACEAGYAGLAAALLKTRIAWRDGDRFQCTALAIQSGQPALLRLLLAAGIDARTRSASGATLLSHAIAAGDVGMVQLLRDAGARADVHGEALAAAAIGGNLEMIGMCIDDGAGKAALASALDHAAQGGQHPAVALLLQAGAPVDPALLNASRRGDTDALDLIQASLSARLLASGEIVARLA
jgi:hypothetical protein